MKTVKFIRYEETEKAYKIIIREKGYNLDTFKMESERYYWIPRSVSNIISSSEIEVQDWFYEKTIYADFKQSLSKASRNY